MLTNLRHWFNKGVQSLCQRWAKASLGSRVICRHLRQGSIVRQGCHLSTIVGLVAPAHPHAILLPQL